jgi:hypothetical protein
MCPKFCPPLLAYVKYGDGQFWKEKFHSANGKAQHALINDPVFSYSKGGGEETWNFFSPPRSKCVLIMSPFSSQRVLKFPMRSPKMCPIAPGFYPIWFAQSLTPLYILYIISLVAYVCLSVQVLKPRSSESNAATLAFIALRYVKTRRQQQKKRVAKNRRQ